MEVLMMVGPYAGEIRDIKPFYAREMIADGRALDPNLPLHPVVAEIPSTVLPTALLTDLPAPRPIPASHTKGRRP